VAPKAPGDPALNGSRHTFTARNGGELSASPGDSGVVGYVRLSRDEERERGTTMEQKVALRREILIAIARDQDVALGDSQVVVELLSGDNLVARPGLTGILDKCRAGEVHTVVAFDIDRLTRDVADLKVIMNAFFRGKVTLITQRDLYRFDKNFDTTLLQILAVLGEKERRSFSYRRKAANDQRARSGEWSSGPAPYGYRWDKDKRIFRIQPDEYAILEEILRRSWTTGAPKIASDLEKRGVRPPGEGKREASAGRWIDSTVSGLTMNPFYAGHTVKRFETDRERNTIALPLSQWIWSEKPLTTVDEEGRPVPLPHPLTRDEWEALQQVRVERRNGSPSAGLLTGSLLCQAGRPMHSSGGAYTCDCKERQRPHKPAAIQRRTVEAPLWEMVWRAADTLRYCRPPDRDVEDQTGRLENDQRLIQRQLREKSESLAELVRRGAYFRSLPFFRTVGPDGKSNYDREVEALAVQCEDLEKRKDSIAAEISSAAARPPAEVNQTALLLANLRESIVSAPIEMQRMLIRLVVERIDLEAPPPGFTTTKRVRVNLRAIGDLPAREEVVAVAWASRNPRGLRAR
jgi:DNA invertase Pin-like site-specific DNA recombinase